MAFGPLLRRYRFTLLPWTVEGTKTNTETDSLFQTSLHFFMVTQEFGINPAPVALLHSAAGGLPVC